MFQQDPQAVGDSLALSALCALIPLLVLFVLLGGLKVRAWIAGLAALLTALVVAVALFSMPAGQAVSAAIDGGLFGFFPILWIVINAVWIYNLTVASGHFDVLRRSFEKVSPDQRIQAIIIAFCFGALLEALAGFGTPVAISVVMLMSLGFKPVKAATVALVANTAPVAFGALAIPIVTLAPIAAGVSNDPRLSDANALGTLGSMVGRQTPILALVVPLVLVMIVDGRRGVRQTWLPALLAGGRLRGRPVRDVQLPLGAAHRHRRLAALRRRRGSPGAGLAAHRGADRGAGRCRAGRVRGCDTRIDGVGIRGTEVHGTGVRGCLRWWRHGHHDAAVASTGSPVEPVGLGPTTGPRCSAPTRRTS